MWEAGKNNFSRFSLSTMPKGKKESDFSHFFKFYFFFVCYLAHSQLLPSMFPGSPSTCSLSTAPHPLQPSKTVPRLQPPRQSHPVFTSQQLFPRKSSSSTVQQGGDFISFLIYVTGWEQTDSQPPKWTFQLK